MTLLEREPALAELTRAFQRAQEQASEVVLIAGEAGVGKSSLLAAFEHQLGGSVSVSWGACEALRTPRPLGPLWDLAVSLPEPVRLALEEQAPPERLFPAVLAGLTARSGVVVIEDLHWADEATLDLLRFLARRLGRTRGVLLAATFRHEEVAADNPLQIVLGDLVRAGSKRMTLEPLSAAAVATLAATAGVQVPELHGITGGNPFFVTEVLASGGTLLPLTVKDAVLARTAGLARPARRVLEAAALVPGRIELETLEAVSGEDYLPGLTENLESGVLVGEGGAVRFRHELARLVCEAAMTPPRRQELARAILDELVRSKASAAQLVHHGAAAGDAATVLRAAPAAVQAAAAAGAHREAASLVRIVLECVPESDRVRRAELLEELSYRCYLTDQLDEALACRLEAAAIRADLGDHLRHGDDVRWLSRLSWFLGRNRDARRYAEEAVSLLELVGPGPELGWAFSNRAQLHMLAQETSEAERWGGKAEQLARTLDDRAMLSHALNNVGTARLLAGDRSGLALLQHALALALGDGHHEHAARAYTNLSSAALELRDYRHAEQYLDEGIDFTTNRDLDSWRLYMLGWRARAALERGRFEDARRDAEIVLAVPRCAPVSRITALVVLGILQSRLEQDGAEETLERVWELAEETGELQRLGFVAAALVEREWLSGRRTPHRARIEAIIELAASHEGGWVAGALVALSRRCGWALDPPPALGAGLAGPWRAAHDGDWQAAAEAFAELGTPFEQGLVLLDGDEAAARRALELFETLGVRSATQRARQRLRELGATSIPRGPYAAARAHPAGLTARELEVLEVLATGASNREIAKRLHLTPKTAEHHVSSILGKLGASDRRDAVAIAQSRGWV